MSHPKILAFVLAGGRGERVTPLGRNGAGRTTVLKSILGLVGRRTGQRLVRRYPMLRSRAQRMSALLSRYHLPVILSLRFLYGLRTVGPIALGMSPVPWARFTALDFAAAVVWAAVVASVGYAFGQLVQLWLGDLKRIEHVLALILIAAGAALWWFRIRTSHPKGK